MQLPAKAHYAVIAVLAMAKEFDAGGLVAARTIAEEHAIPSQFLVQILQQLRAAGLVGSTRGSSGGFRLARPPGAISLADVIDAVCPGATAGPPAEGNSGIQQAVARVWEELSARERAFLESLTLGDMLERVQAVPSTMFYI